MTAWNCPLQALTEAGMRVKFVSKVCKRLTRWTNYTLLGSSFFGGQDLNQGARLPKKVDPFSGVSLEETYGLPELPNCILRTNPSFG